MVSVVRGLVGDRSRTRAHAGGAACERQKDHRIGYGRQRPVGVYRREATTTGTGRCWSSPWERSWGVTPWRPRARRPRRLESHAGRGDRCRCHRPGHPNSGMDWCTSRGGTTCSVSVVFPGGEERPFTTTTTRKAPTPSVWLISHGPQQIVRPPRTHDRAHDHCDHAPPGNVAVAVPRVAPAYHPYGKVGGSRNLTLQRNANA